MALLDTLYTLRNTRMNKYILRDVTFLRPQEHLLKASLLGSQQTRKLVLITQTSFSGICLDSHTSLPLKTTQS